MATKFDALISSLHNNTARLEDDITTEKVIRINEKRQFAPGSQFDTVIAFEGDINSQIITFECIKQYDSHDLSACDKKILKWKNLKSGNEGTFSLITQVPQDSNTFYLSWEVAPDACTEAGTLEISIEFCDFDIENKKVFSWNTSSYKGLSIGSSIASVNFEFPPRDEILVINKESRSIVAPSDYNNTVCSYGDIGVAKVYFLIDRYLGRKTDDFDVMKSEIAIYAKHSKEDYVYNKKLDKTLYTSEIDREKEGKVFITWEVPEEITAGETPWIGNFEIYLRFTESGKVWNTRVYKNLMVEDIPFSVISPDGEEVHISTLQDFVNQYIDDYIEDNYFEIDTND